MAKRGPLSVAEATHIAEENKELVRLKLDIKRRRDRIVKRMRRLEEKGLTLTPAYQTWLKEGPKFGVKGKPKALLELLKERLDEIDALKTATVRGATEHIESMGEQIGSESRDLATIQREASNFYRLRDKVQEMLQVEYDTGSMFGYGEVESAIREVVNTNKIDLSEVNMDVDVILEDIAKMLGADKPPEVRVIQNWYTMNTDL